MYANFEGVITNWNETCHLENYLIAKVASNYTTRQAIPEVIKQRAAQTKLNCLDFKNNQFKTHKEKQGGDIRDSLTFLRQGAGGLERPQYLNSEVHSVHVPCLFVTSAFPNDCAVRRSRVVVSSKGPIEGDVLYIYSMGKTQGQQVCLHNSCSFPISLLNSQRSCVSWAEDTWTPNPCQQQLAELRT